MTKKESKWNEGWGQVITIVASNLAIILTFFNMTITIYSGLREEITDFKNIVQIEMKDFHGRLCEIEARKK